MNKKTIIGIAISSIIILAGIIITCMFGFNFSLIYNNHKEIDIYIGKEFENIDIYEITKEVVGNQRIIVQKVELYQDMASISVKDISDEQLETLNSKINEKYQTENKVENLLITSVSNVRGRDLINPYLLPIGISFGIIAIYLLVYMLVYKKMGKNIKILSTLLKSLGSIIGIQLLYLSIISITRLPINRLTIPTGIILYAITTIVIINKLEKKYKNIEKTK